MKNQLGKAKSGVFLLISPLFVRERLRRFNSWHHLGGLALMVLAIGVGGCQRQATVAPSARAEKRASAAGHAPIWAVQLASMPHGGGGLSIQYNSPSDAYRSTTSIFPAPSKTLAWHRYTWQLDDVSFGGRQNGDADLRLSGGAGLAVHQVTLTTAPPSAGRSAAGAVAPTASIIFDTHPTGANTCSGLRQVLSGGSAADSRYRCVRLGGKSAEILTGNASYIYLRLSRQGRLFRDPPRVLYATVTYTTTLSPAPWSVRTFTHLAARGINYAEINMAWEQVEPEPGHFNFEMLDQTLANAAKAHVRLIPIFWYSVWPGNPAAWITHFDVGSSGATSQVPVWWSHANREAYFHYVTATIAHLKNKPGFGGAFLNFGWLDYMWGPPPGGRGVNGYAPADVQRFHTWLPSRYRTLSAFNRRFHKHYAAWAKVPAAKPDQPLFSAYQHFRNWSVIATYRQLTRLVRRETTAPLYYYWGGGFGGAGEAFNLPDDFFQMARQYHVTVCEDCADHTGLMLLFGSLARAYHVPLLTEWTPRPTGLSKEITQYLGHYGLALPRTVGMDFFLYHGGREFTIGFPVYVRSLKLLGQIHGTYLHTPVAVYISYRGIFARPTVLQGMSNRLAAIWRRLHIAFTVVTDREIKVGVVHLGQFRAVLPLNGRHDPAILAYAAHGGKVLTNASQLAHYARPYIRFAPAANGMEVVPTVDAPSRTAWLTLCNWQFAPAYKHGLVMINWRDLGLPAGSYRVLDAATGRPIAGSASADGFKAPFTIVPGVLKIWKITPLAQGARAATGHNVDSGIYEAKKHKKPD